MASLYGIQQKFGRTPDIDAADTNEDVWDGTGAYAGFLATATAMTVSSSSADDDGAPVGTGALTVAVTGLDANWHEVTQTVIMNGQTGVALPISLIRVYRARVVTVGTGGVNAGDIWIGSGDITTGVPANKYAGILTGLGQTLMSVYSIPANATGGAKIIRWYGSIGAVADAFAVIALQVRDFGGAWNTKRISFVSEGHDLDEQLHWDNRGSSGFVGGIELSAKADIRVRVVSCGVNNSQICAGFDLELYT